MTLNAINLAPGAHALNLFFQCLCWEICSLCRFFQHFYQTYVLSLWDRWTHVLFNSKAVDPNIDPPNLWDFFHTWSKMTFPSMFMQNYNSYLWQFQCVICKLRGKYLAHIQSIFLAQFIFFIKVVYPRISLQPQLSVLSFVYFLCKPSLATWEKCSG